MNEPPPRAGPAYLQRERVNPVCRVVMWLREDYGRAFVKSQIADATGVSRSSIDAVLRDMETAGLVDRTDYGSYSVWKAKRCNP